VFSEFDKEDSQNHVSKVTKLQISVRQA